MLSSCSLETIAETGGRALGEGSGRSRAVDQQTGWRSAVDKIRYCAHKYRNSSAVSADKLDSANSAAFVHLWLNICDNVVLFSLYDMSGICLQLLPGLLNDTSKYG